MIQLIQLLVDFGLFILVWVVQLVIYPSFMYMTEKELKNWHPIYTRRFFPIVGPLMIAQLLIILYRIIVETENIYFVSGLLVALTFTITFAQAVPLHGQIDKKTDSMESRKQLIKVNKIRVFAWSTILLIDVFLLLK